MKLTKEQLVECIVKAFPYPNQITDFDLSRDDSVRFTWRSDRFRASLSGMVEEVRDPMLHGSNLAILAEQLIKIQAVQLLVAAA